MTKNIARRENKPKTLKNEAERNNFTTNNKSKEYNDEIKQRKNSLHDDNMTKSFQNHIDVNNAKKVLVRNNYRSVNKIMGNKKLNENLHNRDSDGNESARLKETHNDCGNDRSNYDYESLDQAQVDNDDNGSTRLKEANNDCDNERSNYDNTRLNEDQGDNDDNDSTRLKVAHNDSDNERSNYDNVRLDEAHVDNDERLDGAHDENDERIMKPSINLIEASLSQDSGTFSFLLFFFYLILV